MNNTSVDNLYAFVLFYLHGSLHKYCIITCTMLNVIAYRVTRSLVLCAMFCRSLFVHLYFFFWPLCCLSSFVDLRILITPLVSSNSSSKSFSYCSYGTTTRNIFAIIRVIIHSHNTNIILDVIENKSIKTKPL